MVLAAAISTGKCVAEGPISEFKLASAGHRPQAIVTGPDGYLWVTEVIKKKLLRVSPTGTITEFSVPGMGVGVLQGIAAGGDGNLWFTSREENAIRRATPDGQFTGTFSIPSKSTMAKSFTPGSWPRTIIAGPDGNLWFSEMAANKIGRITPQGKITEFEVPTKESQPYGIAFDKAGKAWFTEAAGDKVGRLDPATGKIDEFKLPSNKALPRDMAAGPDGSLWFSENTIDKLGRVNSSGEIKEFDLPKGSRPVGVAVTADGNAWYAGFGTGDIGRVTPEGQVTTFPIATPKAQPFGMTIGPDGNVWFAAQANFIGRVDVKRAGQK
jgi:virginiamycin B lyase